MDYEWDEVKREDNIRKHGFDFLDAWMILEEDHTRNRAKPGADGEVRYRATGLVLGMPATVIYTMRGPVVRVISLRRAERHEWQHYQALFR